MFNPVKTAEEVKKQFIGYISTTFEFKDQGLQEQLVKELNDYVSNGPFVEIKDSFKYGKSLNQLINDGLISPLFRDLEINKPVSYKRKLPLDRPLYLHQETAIKKIINGNNVVISTGTGSGKTNCFIIPVINELLKEIKQGTLTDGVRAMFIYPMNALANDQVSGLRELLMRFPQIRFGVYNGGTENNEADAIRLYLDMFKNAEYAELRDPLINEVLSRDEMKKRPPHILFTNYAMLEHLLLRPGDDVIFSNSKFKYVVLDEGHVYGGATGIETSFLMRRLVARVENKPNFIITSATLGDGSRSSNQKVIEFAKNLTGNQFSLDDVITATRDKYLPPNKPIRYNQQFYIELNNSLDDDHTIFQDVLIKYNVPLPLNLSQSETIFEILISSEHYRLLRQLQETYADAKKLITFQIFRDKLEFNDLGAVAFVNLCSKARKDNKPLIDIRYHYFLRALDGAYLSLDDFKSFSLVRKNKTDNMSKMFEIGVCDDCGEISIIGKIIEDKLARSPDRDDYELFQIHADDLTQEFDDNTSIKSTKMKQTEIFSLCRKCAAIVEEGINIKEVCKCLIPDVTRVIKLQNDHCRVCNGTLRRFNLGQEAATGVIATALFENIPENTFVQNQNTTKSLISNNPFLNFPNQRKQQISKGSQFLVFSDSRQGAAKFACYMSEAYKEFLRRRSIWKVIEDNAQKYKDGIDFNEFVNLIESYFVDKRIFRSNNKFSSPVSQFDNKRNSWVSLLNEFVNMSRSTSFPSLGKMKFSYKGNNENVCSIVAQMGSMTNEEAKAFLDILVFDIVKNGAIVTDKNTNLTNQDRIYLFYTSLQKSVVLHKNGEPHCMSWLPTPLPGKKDKYYRNNRLNRVMKYMKFDSEAKAAKFLEYYWEYLTGQANPNPLKLHNPRGEYVIPTDSIKVYFDNDMAFYRCERCGRATQFNIDGLCPRNNCNGKLLPFNGITSDYKNYYAGLYKNAKMSPLFIKEHTAQLSRTEALNYQQQFIKKEINALSCSTTFEMGVDVGDLETIFLRNMPPLPSNYAQRAGRAGRSIDAAAFVITYAKLSSHDLTFFDNPEQMITGAIYPPMFKVINEKIIKRHIYAIAFSMFLKYYPEQYDGNKADCFLNKKGYLDFVKWLQSRPEKLKDILKKSLMDDVLIGLFKVDEFGWIDDLIGQKGLLILLVNRYESDISHLTDQISIAVKATNFSLAVKLQNILKQYQNKEFIDLLVRGNILPKYGFPIDSVELSQNLMSNKQTSINLTRDLQIAISEYAPSSEVVADGGLYTSRYIKKPFVNQKMLNEFYISYIAVCPECQNINFTSETVTLLDGNRECKICGAGIAPAFFRKSIEPRDGFIAEPDVKDVPLTPQEKKYRTEAIYIGNNQEFTLHEYSYGKYQVTLESSSNDALVVKSTSNFYVCNYCGYTIADDEETTLNKIKSYKLGAIMLTEIPEHFSPTGKNKCNGTTLEKYSLHHEFSTDVAKLSFSCDTSDKDTMLSVMFSLLNGFTNLLSIEKKDVKACLTYKKVNGLMQHKIIIYDAVPGGAGHSRRLANDDGLILRDVFKHALSILKSCNCDPSCYKCLRNYENQKIHENLNRVKAIIFLENLLEND